mmetsp:Transcript_23158/g.40973  ORF Transcript_23158/g.40973 Transcript_23158/m.40973 type:complete len:222 (-) Transcript_23158:712-1377(-)
MRYLIRSFLSLPVAGSILKGLSLVSSLIAQGRTSSLLPTRERWFLRVAVMSMLLVAALGEGLAGPYLASRTTRRRRPTLVMSTLRLPGASDTLHVSLSSASSVLPASSAASVVCLESFSSLASLPIWRLPKVKSFWTRSAVASSSISAWSVCEWMVRLTSRLPITASISWVRGLSFLRSGTRAMRPSSSESRSLGILWTWRRNWMRSLTPLIFVEGFAWTT